MVGIGFRRDFAEEFLEKKILQPDFIEVAPENWMSVGGYWKKKLLQAVEANPLFVHGLSLSIGSPDPLDFDFLKKVKMFLDETNASIYSEHLSFSKCDNAHLYDLLPIPFTEGAIKHVAKKIRIVQEFLERELAIEIVSYYMASAEEVSEIDFINEVVSQANCKLLLDVNNIYVNGFNHKYDTRKFIDQLDMDRVSYIHMAGHHKVSDDLIIDTHGADIIDNVYKLLGYALKKLARPVPILLERDYNIPQLEDLKKEMNCLKSIEKESLLVENPT